VTLTIFLCHSILYTQEILSGADRYEGSTIFLDENTSELALSYIKCLPFGSDTFLP